MVLAEPCFVSCRKTAVSISLNLYAFYTLREKWNYNFQRIQSAA